MKKKLFICGSAARMLNSNYFQRKVAPNIDFFPKIFLVIDSYIFHDKKESKICLSSVKKIKKNMLPIPSWDTLLYKTLQKYNNLLNISHIKKWSSFFCSYFRLKKFLLQIDNKNIQIDVVSCPYCGKAHTGPFKIINGTKVELPCCIGKMSKLLHKKNLRLKKGLVQLYLAFLGKKYIMITQEFFNQNKFFIEKKHLEDSFLIQNTLNCKEQTKQMDEYISDFFSTQIKVFKKRSLKYYIDKLGLYIGTMYVIREFLRKYSFFGLSDCVRGMLSRKNIYVNDEKHTSTVIIKRRVL